MTKPSPNWYWLAGAAIVFFFAAAVGSARADIVDEATTACRLKSEVAQIGQALANHDMRDFHKLVDTRLKVGECKPLKPHTEVKVDSRDGDLACVKAKGDAKCAWVLESALQVTNEHREPVRQDNLACKTQLYLDTGRKIMAGNDEEAIKRFKIATSQSGECLTLKKGQPVDIEKRNDKIFCVRPPGEDQCYWTDNLALRPNI